MKMTNILNISRIFLLPLVIIVLLATAVSSMMGNFNPSELSGWNGVIAASVVSYVAWYLWEGKKELKKFQDKRGKQEDH